MTCIVGIEQDGLVYMGGDSAGVCSSYSIVSRGDEKVFMNGNMLLGGTTSFRMLQLLRYSLVLPKQTRNKTDMAWMVTSFIDAASVCFTDKGFMSSDDAGRNVGGSFLVAYHHNLYMICDNFQVQITQRGYDACGCGEAYALGSLYTTRAWKDPVKRIKKALETAVDLSAGVRGPFIIMNSKGEKLA